MPASSSTVKSTCAVVPRTVVSISEPTRRNSPEACADPSPATFHTTPSYLSIVASRTRAFSGSPLTVNSGASSFTNSRNADNGLG